MKYKAGTLDDKYTLDNGRVYITGIQALVRLPIMQRRRDFAAGLNTAGFVSGYRGSPVAAYDLELWHAKNILEANHIKFEPGLNEDIAATAIWGTQQVPLSGKGKYDGVFGIWYGKNPGLDRCGDAFKHANLAGTSPNGGGSCRGRRRSRRPILQHAEPERSGLDRLDDSHPLPGKRSGVS